MHLISLRQRTDWKIQKAVGNTTYAQLLDSADGFYEPSFTDYRNSGHISSHLKTVFDTIKCILFFNVNDDNQNQEDEVESIDKLFVHSPPNLVSTLLVDGHISSIGIKNLLIEYTKTGYVDPRISDLICSSKSYSHPTLSLGEIFLFFVVMTFILSFIIMIAYRRKRNYFNFI